MILRLDDRVRAEARRYRLLFACPDCASFDPGIPAGDAEGFRLAGHEPRCSLGYPVAPHIDPSLDDDRDEIIFCKAFELT
jgi:hypothetical protein